MANSKLKCWIVGWGSYATFWAALAYFHGSDAIVIGVMMAGVAGVVWALAGGNA
jgi:hypothetical protein